MRLTQPFGVDWTGQELYKSLGMLGHNGIDLSAPDGTEAYAAFDGTAYIEVSAPLDKPIPNFNSGYGINIKIRNRELGLEIVYGHLKNTLVENGKDVKAGDLIALCDNTGLSSGSHLHFGVRRIHWEKSGAGPFVDDYYNGYFGFIDPVSFFDHNAFKLPVDIGYVSKRLMGEIDWYKANAWFYNEIKKVEGKRRLMTTREKNAFIYGAWDFRTVVNPAMFPIWSEMTKMAYQDRLRK